MKLWHYEMIPYLPRQQLLGQHREVCACRGNGWGQNHSLVNYVWKCPYDYLIGYHARVMKEMKRRNYTVTSKWFDPRYRGQHRPPYPNWAPVIDPNNLIYPEQNQQYLLDCLDNLEGKIRRAEPGKYDESEIYRFLAYAAEIRSSVDENAN